MQAAIDVNSAELARAMTALVRAFGLHRPEKTPCGAPIAVAEAHTLIDLSEISALNQGELAERLHLEKSTISRLVRQLMVRGWIERTPLPEDGRVMMVRLSKEGRKVAERLLQARRAKFTRLLAAIPETKRSGVIEAISTLAEAASD
jgi:DNA-binding MarR family transcriptional regulator